MCKVVQLESVVCVNVQDLGSSPRSALSPYYFSMYVHMQLQRCGPPYAFQNPTSTCPWRSNQRLQSEAHHKPGQRFSMLPEKVQQGHAQWARIAWI